MIEIQSENGFDSKAKQIIKNMQKFNPDNFRFNESLRQTFVSKYAKDCSESFLWTYNTFSEIFFDLYERLKSLSIYKYNLNILRIECSKIAISDSLNVVDKAKTRMSSFDKNNNYIMSDKPFIGLTDGNSYSPDDIYGGLFDSLKSMYDYIGYVEASSSTGVEVPSQKTILEFFRLTNIYIIAKNDWQEALWHREHISPLEGEIVDNPLRYVRAVGLYRGLLAAVQGESFQENRVDFRHPPILLDKKDDLKKLKIRKFVRKQIACIRETRYGQKIGNEFFVKYKDVKLSEVLEIYFYLEVICRTNVEEVISGRVSTRYFDYFNFDYNSILDYLSVMTGWGVSKIIDIINLIKFTEGAREEIWHQPLLLLNGKVVLLFPIFMYGNVERLISHLCSKLEIDVAKFGNLFERHARLEILKRARQSKISPLFKMINCSNFEITGSKEEIDLCFIINDCLFVGELKSDFFAADAISFGDHVTKVEEAAGQVTRKAKFIAENLTDFRRIFCNGSHIDSVFPFILVDQRHLSGAMVDGCPVIDLVSLTKFFDGRLPFRIVQSPSGSIRVGKFVDTFVDLNNAHNDLQKYMIENPYINEIGAYAVTRPLPRSGGMFKKSYLRADIRIDPCED